jgi:hypothetical protein
MKNANAPSCEARSRGGLGEMTRRKREIVGLMNERDFPHLVELALPPGPFRGVILEIDAFHRERRIPVRRGRSRHEAKQSYISASQTPPRRMHFTIASVASVCRPVEAQAGLTAVKITETGRR